MVVRIGLAEACGRAIGEDVELSRHGDRARLGWGEVLVVPVFFAAEPSAGEDVLLRIKARRLLPRDAQGRIIRHAHAKVVSLQTMIAPADLLGHIDQFDAWQKPARRHALDDVRIDMVAELMPLKHLCAVERFAVGRVVLTPDVMRHASLGKEVTFVRGIDELLRVDGQSAEHLHAHDAIAILCDGVEKLAAAQGDVRACEQAFEHARCSVRLEVPLFVFAVMLAEVTVELP